jgi:hypothetical protein
MTPSFVQMALYGKEARVRARNFAGIHPVPLKIATMHTGLISALKI